MRAVLRIPLAWISATLRVFPGAVLAVSGYLKAVRPAQEFAAVLEGYWVLPPSLVLPLARGIPWVELWVGVCLLLGYGTRKAAGAAAILYATFVVFLSQALLRKLPLTDCGCFGNIGPTLKPSQSLTMDVVLLACCCFVIWVREGRFSLDRWIQRAK